MFVWKTCKMHQARHNFHLPRRGVRGKGGEEEEEEEEGKRGVGERERRRGRARSLSRCSLSASGDLRGGGGGGGGIQRKTLRLSPSWVCWFELKISYHKTRRVKKETFPDSDMLNVGMG